MEALAELLVNVQLFSVQQYAPPPNAYERGSPWFRFVAPTELAVTAQSFSVE